MQRNAMEGDNANYKIITMSQKFPNERKISGGFNKRQVIY
jgi:acid stress-induced BolA-like protein IbaG/YrbA